MDTIRDRGEEDVLDRMCSLCIVEGPNKEQRVLGEVSVNMPAFLCKLGSVLGCMMKIFDVCGESRKQLCLFIEESSLLHVEK